MMPGHVITTLQELQAAHQQGLLTKDNPLIFDNDSTYIYFGEDDGEHGWPGDGPAVILRAALDLLGIPWEDR